MLWQYLLVFFGAMLVDIVPFPFPPAFTVMIFMQAKFDLDIWDVIFIGVAGSIMGRFLLTLYIPSISDKIFSRAKNEDVRFLGGKIKGEFWKSQAFIVLYSLLPLPTTPLFVAGGMARVKPYLLIPAFTIGKFTSDMVAVFTGSYATHNVEAVLKGIMSWESITGCIIGLVLIFVIVFIDWHTLLIDKRFVVNFNVFKKRKPRKSLPHNAS